MKRMTSLAVFICVIGPAGFGQIKQYRIADTLFYQSTLLADFDSITVDIGIKKKKADETFAVGFRGRMNTPAINNKLADKDVNELRSVTISFDGNWVFGGITRYVVKAWVPDPDKKVTHVDTLLRYITLVYDPPVQPIETKKGFGGLTDQDVFSGDRNEDRNYTMGIVFEFIGPKTDRWNPVALLRSFADGVTDNIHAKSHGPSFVQHANTWGGTGFTPFNIGDSNIIVNERPYGFLFLFGSRKTLAYDDGDGMMIPYSVTSEFTTALLGTSAGREVQSYIHKHHWAGSTRPIPRGWDHQIGQGGQFAAMYHFGMNFLIADNNRILNCRMPDVMRTRLHWYQLSVHGDGMVGYYSNVAAGATFRLGWFGTPYWMNNNISLVASQAVKKEPKCSVIRNWRKNENIKRFEFFVYSTVRERVVGWNTFLTGSFIFKDKPDTYHLEYDQINHFISEFEWGMTVRYYGLSLFYKPLVLRTSEYHTEYSRTHYYGTVGFAIDWKI